MGFVNIQNKISEAVASVDNFNAISLDKSKTMFKECLGTDFPFDVLEAAKKYVGQLSNILNVGLDGLLCGTSIGDVAGMTKDLIDTTVSSTKDAVELFTSDDEEELAKARLPVDHIITSNDWIKTYDEQSGHFDTIYELMTDHNIGAKYVDIDTNATCSNCTYDENTNTYALTVTLNITVAIDELHRGPNDGRTEYTDGENIFPPVTGVFSYSKTLNLTGDGKIPRVIQFGAIDCPFSGCQGITLKICGNIFGLVANKPNPAPRYNFILSPLTYKKQWSDLSNKLTSFQQKQVDEIKNATTTNAKNHALMGLKSQFMTSSEIDGAMDKALDKMLGDKAFAAINKDNIKYSVKNSIANSAIALANGDDLTLDKTVVSTIAGEITASSINAGLAHIGIDTSISSDCTKELIGKVLDLLPDATLENPFGGITNFIDTSKAFAFAQNVLNQLNARFNELMSAECMQAINNTFDLCSNNIAEATGNTLELVNAAAKGNAAGAAAAKKFLAGKSPF